MIRIREKRRVVIRKTTYRGEDGFVVRGYTEDKRKIADIFVPTREMADRIKHVLQRNDITRQEEDDLIRDILLGEI